MTRRVIALGVVLAALLGLLPGRAAAEDPQPSQQALLLLRVLAYDRELKRRSGGERVVVAVVFRAGDKASEDAAAKIVRAMEVAAEGATVLGMPVQVVSFPADATLDEKVRMSRAAALYVSPGLEDSLGPLIQVTRRRSVLSLTTRYESVRSGVAVGFVLRTSRISVIVNLPAARAEGVDFESAFLRVAEVIKE